MKKIQTFICAVITLLSVTQLQAQPVNSKEAVLSAYYGIKNALISGDAAASGVKAKELLTPLTSFPAESLSASEKTVWKKYGDKLQFDARHIAESKDINHQREHFASLSENMLGMIKVMRFNRAPVYYDYCPMKKSYWLSETATIKNPYFGNRMLTCGDIKETLPAVQ